MKYLMRTALIAASLACAGVQAAAQHIGIEFNRMPIGTQMFYVDNKGDKWVEVYVGKSAGRHVVKLYSGHTKRGQQYRTDHYDSKGRLIQYSLGSKGLRFRFRPYRCDFALGSCTHKKTQLGDAYVNVGSSRSFNVRTTLRGNELTEVWTSPSSEGQTVVKAQLTKYNLRKSYTWGSQGSVKLLKIQ